MEHDFGARQKRLKKVGDAGDAQLAKLEPVDDALQAGAGRVQPRRLASHFVRLVAISRPLVAIVKRGVYLSHNYAHMCTYGVDRTRNKSIITTSIVTFVTRL